MIQRPAAIVRVRRVDENLVVVAGSQDLANQLGYAQDSLAQTDCLSLNADQRSRPLEQQHLLIRMEDF